jgi:branched-chain amino acid transport system permease protein
MTGLYLIVMKTRMGTAMRATSEDRDAASLMGIDVNRVIIFTFILGGSMAGIGGVLYAFVFKQVYFFMGFFPGIKAFSAAVLGGIGNIPGAMLGGFFLGTVESVGPALFLDGLGIVAPYQLRDLIAFTMLVMVLIFRPQGILGERVSQRA